MIAKERLYDAFGELIYAVALADGAIQNEEITKLNEILNKHQWAKEIEWSFNYEKSKSITVKDAYTKAMSTFKDYGPDPEYQNMLEVMLEVAKAFNGIVPEEQKIIDDFQKELREKFIKDVEERNMYF